MPRTTPTATTTPTTTAENKFLTQIHIFKECLPIFCDKLSRAMTTFAINSRSCSDVIIIVDDYDGNNNNNNNNNIEDDDTYDGTMRPDITHRI